MDFFPLVNFDITTIQMGVIAQGVNCQGAMGSGVAGAIKKKWPIVFDAFKRNSIGKTMLGTCHLIAVNEQDTLFVANCYTQVFYGYGGGRYADPKAIEHSLNSAYSWADYYHLPLYMPKIGAGLGGIDWLDEVEPIIRQEDNRWSRVDTYICLWDDNVTPIRKEDGTNAD